VIQPLDEDDVETSPRQAKLLFEPPVPYSSRVTNVRPKGCPD